jgi:hypothetical protein
LEVVNGANATQRKVIALTPRSMSRRVVHTGSSHNSSELLPNSQRGITRVVEAAAMDVLSMSDNKGGHPHPVTTFRAATRIILSNKAHTNPLASTRGFSVYGNQSTIHTHPT